MYQNEDYLELHKYIRRNDTSSTLEFLGHNGNLNVTDQSIFNMAIESQNIVIVTALLKYFENQLSMYYKTEDYESKRLKHKMQNVLEAAIEDKELVDDMKKAISSYINFDSNTEQDLNEEDFSSSYSEEGTSTSSEHEYEIDASNDHDQLIGETQQNYLDNI